MVAHFGKTKTDTAASWSLRSETPTIAAAKRQGQLRLDRSRVYYLKGHYMLRYVLIPSKNFSFPPLHRLASSRGMRAPNTQLTAHASIVYLRNCPGYKCHKLLGCELDQMTICYTIRT
jgi:hypothetical protein